MTLSIRCEFSECVCLCVRMYLYELESTRVIWSLENHVCNFCCRIRYVCIIYFDWKFDWFVPMCLGFRFLSRSPQMYETWIYVRTTGIHFSYCFASWLYIVFLDASMAVRWKPAISGRKRFKHKIELEKKS